MGVDQVKAMRASLAILQTLGPDGARCVAEIGELYNRAGEDYEERDRIQAKYGVSDREMHMAVKILETLCR